MNILIVHPLSVRFAAFCYINEFALALAEKGDRICVLSPADEDQRLANGREPDFETIALEFEGPLLSKTAKRKIFDFSPDIIHVWTPRGMPSRVGLEVMVSTGAKVVVNYEDPEHFHFDTLNGPVKAAHALEHMDKPFITGSDLESFVSDLNWFFILDTFQDPGACSFIHPLFFALINRAASAYTAIWHPWKDLLTERFKKPVALMPYSMDFSAESDQATGIDVREELNISKETLLFLRTGTIYHMVDDMGVLLAGFADFNNQHPDSVLVLCGRDETPERTSERIDKLGITDKVVRIKFTGFDQADRYKALVRAADVTLAPGYPDDYNRYRLAMKIIEYMTEGKPMICYASGIGESLTHGENALLLDDYSPSTVASLMKQLANDPTLRQNMGAKARETAKSWFNVKTLADTMHDFYADVVEDRTDTTGSSEVKDWGTEQKRKELWESSLEQFCGSSSNIYIYGGGKHTVALSGAGWLKKLNAAAIIDDSPSADEIDGTPVKTASELSFQNDDILIISSDSIEEKLYTSALNFFPSKDRIVRLYS